jgi:3-oxoacyl-(acyl-carrier-protein) synthase
VLEPHPAITGCGLVTALGQTVQSTWDAITVESRSISDHTAIPVDRRHGSRAATLAVQAAHEAIAHARWSQSILADSRTALVVATSKGEIEDWNDFHPPAGRINHWGLGGLASHVAHALQCGNGPRITLSSACSTGLHALARACLMLRLNEADRVLVVAAEASVQPLFIGSFNRLGVLAPPGHGCRPFDRTRAGFVMTEAAAAICLEREPISPPLTFVTGYRIAGDASHLTASDPHSRAQRFVLAKLLNGGPVDLIHAHGTGTIINDPLELEAIESCLKFVHAFDVPVYSHKGHLGHTLGAAGLVAIVLNTMIHQQAMVPANPRTTDPLQTEHSLVLSTPWSGPVRRSITLASGFGGALGGIRLESV